jgi:hypothetical protein
MDILFGTKRARPDSNPSTPEGPPVLDAEEPSGINKVIAMLTEMRTENANMAASVNTLDTKFTLVLTEFETVKKENEALRTENISMKEALFAMQNRQENLEVQSKSCNLILFNITESKPADTNAAIKALLGNEVGSTIVETRRLGPFRPNAAKARPVLIRFSSTEGKHMAFTRGKELRTRGIFLDDDLTMKEQADRQRLRGEFTRLKNEGKSLTWRRGKLMIRIKEGVLAEHKPEVPAGPSSSSAPA